MYTRFHDREDGRQNSILTTTQRKLLKSNVKSGITTERKRIRERVREGLRDFRILADHLEERDREMIFEMPPGTDESRELQLDVQAAIEFLYTGMGGEAGLRKPLERGVSSGEVALGNAVLPLEVEASFRMNRVPKNRHAHDIVDLIESGEWDQLHPIDLLSFIKWAMSAEILDFDSIREQIDQSKEVAEMQEEKIKNDVMTGLAYAEVEEEGNIE